MPLVFLVPQRVQPNLDLTDAATVLSVAFSVTNYRYSNLLGVTVSDGSDRVLTDYNQSDEMPGILLNSSYTYIMTSYDAMWPVVTAGTGGEYSLTNIAYVELPVVTAGTADDFSLQTVSGMQTPIVSFGTADDYSLRVDAFKQVPAIIPGTADDFSLTSTAYTQQPAVIGSVIPNGSTYAADRDTNDPYVSTNVVLLVPADGGDGSTNIVDSIGHGISVVGNTAVSTTQSKFGDSSLYFDGTGDYLTLPNSTEWAMGTGDYTIEGWVYPTTLTPYSTNSCRVLADFRASPGGPGICIGIGANGYPFVYCAPLGWNGAGSTQKFVVNTWNHFAFVRRGNEFFYFINGRCGMYLTATANLTDNALTIGATIDFRDTSANYKFQGYMDALRITKGVARYIEKFTPPAVMFPTPAVAVADSLYPYVSDPFAASVVLALDLDSANIVDHKGHIITAAGNAGISTVKSKFGKYSLYFDGTGDYIYSANGVDWAMGTGNYTLDAWVYPTQTGVQMTIFDTRASAAGAGIWYGINTTGNIATWGFGGAWTGSASPKAVNYNAWNHIAFVRSGTNFYIFLNGNLEVTFTGVGANSTDQALTIGGPIDYRDTGTTNKFVGYMDSVRITKGIARWSANFVPPTVRGNQVDPYANKVSLHLPFENSGDNGSLLWEATGKALTATGTINTGGSNDAYKGQSCAMFTAGSYLSVPTSTDFNLSSGDFTIEMWVNTKATNQFCCLVNRLTSGAGTFGAGSWSMHINSATGNGLLYLAVADYSTNVAFLVGTIPVNDGRWHHVAWTRSGSTHTFWVDGVQDTSTTWAATIGDLTTPLVIGNDNNFGGRSFVGSLDDLRITKGVCRYYAAFNPEIDDPFWNYTSVLLPLAADTSEVQGRTITTSGTVTTGQTSVARVYDTGATYLNSGLVLTAANNSMEPGSGDFTYEFWFNTASSARQWLFAAANDYWVGVDYNYVGAGLFGFWLSSNGTSWDIATADPGGNSRGAIVAALNKWNHVALVRKGTSITLYVNGVADKTITVTAGTSIVNKSGQQKRIGNAGTVNYPVIGYMQDFRFTKGYARYTSNFVPCDCPMPTTDMIDKSYDNVTTLLPMSNDLVDKKNNTYTNTGITFAEDDSFGKAAVFNGSAYYSSNNNINWQDTTDATFEAWVYAASWATWSSDWGAGAIPSLMFSGQAMTRNVLWAFGPTADAKLTFYYWSGGLNFFKSTSTLSVNAWHHIALSKQGTTLRFFIDGVLDTTTTYSAAAAVVADMVLTGGNVNSVGLTGRVRNLRVTKGYARYIRKFNPAKILATRLS